MVAHKINYFTPASIIATTCTSAPPVVVVLSLPTDILEIVSSTQDGPDAGVSLRGCFIISPEGILRQITINDLPVGRNPDEILRLVQAFQFTDKHGEVCPASWRPGAKTMHADPVKSAEYFKST